MRFWPFGRRAETRTSGYSDLLVSALVTAATETGGGPAAIGAVEAAAGLWARSFAAARVTPANAVTAALSPATLAFVARELCRRGESLHVIDVRGGRVRLIPAFTWHVDGGPDPASWRYRVTAVGPSTTTTRTIPAAGVVHVRYAVEPGRPWQGLAPLVYAAQTRRLGVNLETSLADETGGPVGSVIPVPEGHQQETPDGETDPFAKLKADLAALKGHPALVETMAGGFGDRGGRPDSDWRPRRIGADPPAALSDVRAGVTLAILAACGIPPALAGEGDGTAQREALRRFLHTTLDPLGRLVSAELSDKLDVTVTLDFGSLFAADVQGRARAWRALAGKDAKMEPGKAAALTGLS